jgi:hypothetical protein
MVQYIDKSALVAEIKRRIKEHHSGYLVCLKDILSFVDTLEVKEVNLDKEIDLVEDKYHGFESSSRADIINIAKHFFELGLKAQKGK